MTKEKKETTQLYMCIGLLISGVCLLFAGLCIPPVGVIDNSILVAFGEIVTFAGSVIGIDYKYKSSIRQNLGNNDK